MFALKRISLGSVLDCVAPCSEESLLSLGHLLDLNFQQIADLARGMVGQLILGRRE